MESESTKLAFYTFSVNFIGLMTGTAVYLLSDLLLAAFGFLTGIIGSSFLVFSKERKRNREKSSTAELFQQAVSNRKKR